MEVDYEEVIEYTFMISVVMTDFVSGIDECGLQEEIR